MRFTDHQGYIIGERTHYVQFGLVKLTLRTPPRVDAAPIFVGSEIGLDMLSCEHCPEEIGRVVWDGSAFRCRCGARYQAKLQQQPTAPPRPILCQGERVRTPQGAGTVAYARMTPPTFNEVEVYSVKLDSEAERRGLFCLVGSVPSYQGTIFAAADVAKLEA